MIVIVAMVMTVRMAMVMMIMSMIVVMVIVALIAHRRVVGAALRLERRIDGDHLGTEALQQRLDRRIGLEPEPALQHLHRHMAVAEVPSEPGERRQIGGPRLDQRLGFRHDLDEPAVVEHQRVVCAQPHRLGEVDFDAGAFDAEQESLLRLTLGMRQNKRVDGGRIPPLGGTKDAGGAACLSDQVAEAGTSIEPGRTSGSSAGGVGKTSDAGASAAVGPCVAPTASLR